MKKSRIFLTVGTLVLAITAIFATKANKKFAGSVNTAVQQTGGLVIKYSSSTVMTTTGTGLSRMELGLNGTTGIGNELETTTSTHNAVFYK